MISRNTSPLHAYSPEYQKRRAAPLARGFVLVRNPGTRRALVHVVKAETFGGLARLLISGKVVKTLCERAVVTGSWNMIPRQPDGGYLISCNNCRGALSHYRAPNSASSDPRVPRGRAASLGDGGLVSG